MLSGLWQRQPAALFEFECGGVFLGKLRRFAWRPGGVGCFCKHQIVFWLPFLLRSVQSRDWVSLASLMCLVHLLIQTVLPPESYFERRLGGRPFCRSPPGAGFWICFEHFLFLLCELSFLHAHHFSCVCPV